LEVKRWEEEGERIPSNLEIVQQFSKGSQCHCMSLDIVPSVIPTTTKKVISLSLRAQVGRK